MPDKYCDRCKVAIAYRVSETYRSICDSCFDDLVDLGVTANVAEFMKTKTKANSEIESATIAYFSSLFEYVGYEEE